MSVDLLDSAAVELCMCLKRFVVNVEEKQLSVVGTGWYK